MLNIKCWFKKGVLNVILAIVELLQLQVLFYSISGDCYGGNSR